MGAINFTPQERNEIWDIFFQNSEKHESGCWVWNKTRYRNGYGQFHVHKKNELAHRVAFTLSNESGCPARLYICHRCDNPPCVNPEHLFLGNSKTNMEDARSKGRLLVGERISFSKLKECQVMEILKSKDTLESLARRFNVSHSLIWRIRKGIIWKHLIQALNEKGQP